MASATATGQQPPSSAPQPGAGLTAEELAQASGLELTTVRELDSYGLIAGRVLGASTYYDEDALVVARIAASFSDYGVEVRHLRLHLLAAQREASFIEQIVLPLLKQRNPASKQRAQETVSELSRLGRELRTTLLQGILRALVGG
jgi:DNA-binding transcriptional MerR regulator